MNTNPKVITGALADNVVASASTPAFPRSRQKLLGIAASYSAAVAAVKDIIIKKISDTVEEVGGVLNAVTLSRGSTDTAVASTAFNYLINGVQYSKAAVAAGTALAPGTIPQDKWGLYLFSINAAGTITVTAAAANFTTGYDDENAAIAALPATPANSVSMGYVTVLTAVGAAFVGGTDALEGGASGSPSSDTNYYSTTAASLTTLATIQWDFNHGAFCQRLPGPVEYERGEGIVVELEASGAGGTSGLVAIFADTPYNP